MTVEGREVGSVAPMKVGVVIRKPVMLGKCENMAAKSKNPVAASKPTEVEFSGMKMGLMAVKKVTADGIRPKSLKRMRGEGVVASPEIVMDLTVVLERMHSGHNKTPVKGDEGALEICMDAVVSLQRAAANEAFVVEAVTTANDSRRPVFELRVAASFSVSVNVSSSVSLP